VFKRFLNFLRQPKKEEKKAKVLFFPMAKLDYEYKKNNKEGELIYIEEYFCEQKEKENKGLL